MNKYPIFETGTALIDRRCFEAIEEAIRAKHQISYISEQYATAGFQNVIVWGTPHEDGGIVLIAGES